MDQKYKELLRENGVLCLGHIASCCYMCGFCEADYDIVDKSELRKKVEEPVLTVA